MQRYILDDSEVLAARCCTARYLVVVMVVVAVVIVPTAVMVPTMYLVNGVAVYG